MWSYWCHYLQGFKLLLVNSKIIQPSYFSSQSLFWQPNILLYIFVCMCITVHSCTISIPLACSAHSRQKNTFSNSFFVQRMLNYFDFAENIVKHRARTSLPELNQVVYWLSCERFCYEVFSTNCLKSKFVETLDVSLFWFTVNWAQRSNEFAWLVLTLPLFSVILITVFDHVHGAQVFSRYRKRADYSVWYLKCNKNI